MITDYDGNSKFYKKDKKPRKYKFYKLKRLMCVFGVAFGITAAIKSATHYNVNSNGDIKVEKEDNKTNNINSNKKIEKNKEKKR